MVLYRLDPTSTSGGDAQCAAEAADLVYVSREGPGITRRRFGKGFAYYKPSGSKIEDPKEIERLNAMAIPPAYRDVWICPKKNGHLQAVGIDDRGRLQYRYHERWAQVRDRAKFDKLADFARGLPSLRRTIRRDLKLSGLPRQKVLAACVKLLDKTYMRIGNADYATANDSYGLTTLQDGHAEFAKGTVRFEFKAKHGILREIQLKDSLMAQVVKACQDLPGQELLQYLDEDGTVRDIGSGDVNGHIHGLLGDDFSAKTFRTWHATVLAAKELQGVELASSKTAINKQVVAAIDAVAGHLGNTRAVCRKCYVDPRVTDAFENGTLDDCFESGKKVRGLTLAESATLCLLESNDARHCG